MEGEWGGCGREEERRCGDMSKGQRVGEKGKKQGKE
jgi:hypothetical protein